MSEPSLDQDTRWVASIFMLCPTQNVEQACLLAAEMSKNPRDATPQFFSRPIKDASGEVVYYAAHSQVRGVILSQMPAFELMFEGAQWCITRWLRRDEPVRPITSVYEFMEGLGVVFADQDEERESEINEPPKTDESADMASAHRNP